MHAQRSSEYEVYKRVELHDTNACVIPDNSQATITETRVKQVKDDTIYSRNYRKGALDALKKQQGLEKAARERKQVAMEALAERQNQGQDTIRTEEEERGAVRQEGFNPDDDDNDGHYFWDEPGRD
jgi:hypothetical protein